jgi:hypothetical protein
MTLYTRTLRRIDHRSSNDIERLQAMLEGAKPINDSARSFPDLIAFDLIKIALPAALVYLVLHVTNGWFMPAGERLSDTKTAVSEECYA